jgi:hypothetical protein
MHQRAGTHGAGLNCNKELTVSQSMVTEVCTGFAQGDDFGMSAGIVIGNIAIPAAAYDLTVAHNDRAYGDFARFKGALGGAEGFFHPKFVGNRRWSLVIGRWPGWIRGHASTLVRAIV